MLEIYKIKKIVKLNKCLKKNNNNINKLFRSIKQ